MGKCVQVQTLHSDLRFECETLTVQKSYTSSGTDVAIFICMPRCLLATLCRQCLLQTLQECLNHWDTVLQYQISHL